jgi:hypothetical protein
MSLIQLLKKELPGRLEYNSIFFVLSYLCG